MSNTSSFSIVGKWSYLIDIKVINYLCARRLYVLYIKESYKVHYTYMFSMLYSTTWIFFPHTRIARKVLFYARSKYFFSSALAMWLKAIIIKSGILSAFLLKWSFISAHLRTQKCLRLQKRRRVLLKAHNHRID